MVKLRTSRRVFFVPEPELLFQKLSLKLHIFFKNVTMRRILMLLQAEVRWYLNLENGLELKGMEWSQST